jgi:coniferyl-aldehyde dehydrogenase
MQKPLNEILEAQRRSFLTEGYPTFEVRAERLDRACKMLLDFEPRIVEALYDDFGGRSRFQSRMGDVVGSIKVLEYTKQQLREWMKPMPVQLPPEAAAVRAEVLPVPLGVIGVIVPWNGPVLMTCLAVAGAFGAGNRVMVKSSELTPRTSRVLAEAFSTYFRVDEAVAIEGEADVAAEFSRLKFDHLIFTGSTSTGRKVMRAAAENLVPVTLEMGGKCPVVIGKSANIAEAAARIVTGKLAGAGQVCVAPDYVYLPAGKAEEFISSATEVARKIYPDMLRNEDYTAVINESNRLRIRRLLDDAVAKGAELVQVPEMAGTESTSTRMPFVVATKVSPAMKIMEEEIFGPVLPVLEYGDFSEPLAEIANNPHPLSASYFGDDEDERRRFIEEVQTGSVLVNDVRIQLFYEALPFGGVGASGIGRYRGYEGFKTFSNIKTVLHQTADESALAAQRPPFGERANAFASSVLERMRSAPSGSERRM